MNAYSPLLDISTVSMSEESASLHFSIFRIMEPSPASLKMSLPLMAACSGVDEEMARPSISMETLFGATMNLRGKFLSLLLPTFITLPSLNVPL